jgi:hypothetical protein
MNKTMIKRLPELTVIDIAKVVKWKDVKRALRYYYPEDKSDYTSLFERIRAMKIKEWPKGKREYLVIDIGGWFFMPDAMWRIKNAEKLQDSDTETYPSVWLAKEGDKTHWAMSFMPWQDAASLIISKETLSSFTLPEIVAHFIWEITFYGGEDESLKLGEEINKRAEDAIKQIEAGKKQPTK